MGAWPLRGVAHRPSPHGARARRRRWSALGAAPRPAPRPVVELSIADQQMVEIARAINGPTPASLILDEPTSSLACRRGRPGASAPCAAIRPPAASPSSTSATGWPRSAEIADSATVMRDGRSSTRCPVEGRSHPRHRRLMLGQAERDSEQVARALRPAGQSCVEVRDLAVAAEARRTSASTSAPVRCSASPGCSARAGPSCSASSPVSTLPAAGTVTRRRHPRSPASGFTLDAAPRHRPDPGEPQGRRHRARARRRREHRHVRLVEGRRDAGLLCLGASLREAARSIVHRTRRPRQDQRARTADRHPVRRQPAEGVIGRWLHRRQPHPAARRADPRRRRARAKARSTRLLRALAAERRRRDLRLQRGGGARRGSATASLVLRGGRIVAEVPPRASSADRLLARQHRRGNPEAA